MLRSGRVAREDGVARLVEIVTGEAGLHHCLVGGLSVVPASKTLEVEMSNCQVYQYVGVYPEVYRRFMAAPNPTSFFDDKIAEEYTGKRV